MYTSFLDLDILSLPKSCQESYSRIGTCRCPPCRGINNSVHASSSSSLLPTAPASEGYSGSSIQSKLRSIFSSKKSSDRSLDHSGNNSSSIINNNSVVGGVKKADGSLDPAEVHLLKILPAVGQLWAERELEELQHGTEGSVQSGVRGVKRKAVCEEEDVVVKTGYVQMDGWVGTWRRKRLVPSSRVQKLREWREEMERLEKNKGRSGRVGESWDRLKREVEKRVERGYWKYRRAIGKDRTYLEFMREDV